MKKKIYRSMSTRLSATIVNTVLLISFLTMGVLLYYSRGLILKQSMQNADEMLENVAFEISSRMAVVEVAVNNTAIAAVGGERDPEYAYKISRSLVRNNEPIIGSAVAFERNHYRKKGEFYAPYTCYDAVDSLMSFQMGGEDYDYFNMEWYRECVRSGKPYWCEPYFDEGGGDQIMTTYSVPLKYPDGHIFGVLTSDISLADLSQRLESLRLYPNSYAFILSGSGVFVACPDTTKVLEHKSIFDAAEGFGDPQIATLGEKMMSGENGCISIKAKGDKQKWQAVYMPLDNGWSVAMMCPEKDIFADLYRFILMLLCAMTVLTALMYTVLSRVIRRSLQPVTEYAYVALNIAKGNFKAELPPVETDDEIHTLRDSLEFMVRSVDDYIRELSSATAANMRYEGELDVARDIQLNMLPQSFPQAEVFDIYARVSPAREVGGDLFDYNVVGDRLYFVVGDVSGKGVPAALFMATTRSAFQILGGLHLGLSGVCGRINNVFCSGNSTGMFITFLTGCLNLKTGELGICNAGHNPMVIVGPDGKASYYKAKTNLAAGIMPDFLYEAETITLEKGSRIILYTDGVTEAEKASKEQYGDNALLSLCESIGPEMTAQQTVDAIFDAVHTFADGNPQNDDITAMCIKY